MSFKNRQFIWAQLAYILTISIAVGMMPGAGFWTTTISLTTLWLLIDRIYALSPYKNSVGRYSLLAIATLLSLGVIANTHMYTIGARASDATPLLLNDDASKYFNGALHIIGDPNGIKIKTLHLGYPHFIAAIWKITGVSIFYPILVNMAMLLLSLIVTGIITTRLIGKLTPRSPQWIASAAMIATAAVSYHLITGTVLLKEAGTALAVSLTAVSLTPWNKKSLSSFIFHLSSFAIGIILLMIFRFNYIAIIAIGVILLSPWHKKRLSAFGFHLSSLVLCALAWAVMHLFVLAETDVTHLVVNSIDGGALGGAYFFDNPQHRAHNAIVAGYFEFPVWKRLLFLPISAVTQFLIPFPWPFTRDLPFGYTLVYARFAFPWYLIGGLILYFLATSLRRIPRHLLLWSIFAVIAWLIPAYFVAGTVSRYALCFVPLLIPLAIYTLATALRTKAFQIYSVSYIAVLITVLIVCHHIQQAAV